MKVSRALLAAALQITVTAAFTSAVVLFLAPMRDQSLRGAFWGSAETVGPMPRMVVGVFAAFFAGWWGASGLTRRRIEQGFLIGALVALFGALLALIEGEIGARADTLLLAVVAAVTGSAMASLQPRIRRAFVAAGMQVVVTIILGMTLSLLLMAWLRSARGQLGDTEVAIYQTHIPWVTLLLRTTTGFLAGWWGARGLGSEAVRYGLLIGVLIEGFSVSFILVLGREVPFDLLTIPLMSLSVGAATAGAVFAKSRHQAEPV